MTTAARAGVITDLEDQVGVLLRRGRRVVAERARAIHPDLPPSSLAIFGHVAKHGPLRAVDLCDVMDVDKGAISRTLGHLIELGLLDKAPDPDDGRATLVSVSAEGAARLRDIAAARRALVEERLADWSDDEVGQVVDALDRLNTALD